MRTCDSRRLYIYPIQANDKLFESRIPLASAGAQQSAARAKISLLSNACQSAPESFPQRVRQAHIYTYMRARTNRRQIKHCRHSIYTVRPPFG